MTGLERNADVVEMASYAPLFAHAEGWQWTPDLIWVDNLRSYGTANYHVQKLFSTNRGTDVVPVLAGDKAVSGQQELYASATIDRETNELILKVVNSSAKKQQGTFKLEGLSKINGKGTLTVLSSDDLDLVNSFERPDAIAPVISQVAVRNKTIDLPMNPYSVNVMRVRL
jgi:alpha-N-arabinofuranosidase